MPYAIVTSNNLLAVQFAEGWSRGVGRINGRSHSFILDFFACPDERSGTRGFFFYQEKKKIESKAQIALGSK